MIKIIKITIIGLVIAMLIYPFTHELGHTLTCLIVGAEVLEFEVLPVPHITCNIIGLTKSQIIAIGLSGNIVPLFIIGIIDVVTRKVKEFELLYAKVYFYFCCWLSMVFSAVSGIFMIMKEDDVYNIINRYPEEKVNCTIICVILAIVIMIRVYKIRIVKQFINYIDR